MAYFTRNHEDFDASRIVSIIATEPVDNYTVYVIQVVLGPYFWTVKHRYSEFYEIHEKLAAKKLVEKSLLPPKKFFGNQNVAFIRQRQQELEFYLQAVVQYLHILPPLLTDFLAFPQYEIHGISQALAEELFHRGDNLLQHSDTVCLSPLHLNAITQRLKLAEPTCDSGDLRKDLGHVLDFFSRAKHLKIQGSVEQVGTSNFSLNQLPFEMNLFKSLKSLQLVNCDPAVISGYDSLKGTLKKFEVHKMLQGLKDVLIDDVMYWESDTIFDESVSHSWKKLRTVDFSHNQVTEIDESVRLLPAVQKLNLSHNKIDSVQNLHHLSSLSWLRLDFNEIQTLEALHTKMGNVKHLYLSGNRVSSLAGFSKLYSLESLDMSYNNVSELSELTYIGSLPCLENLNMTSNPVTHSVDYRTKALEHFGDRLAEITLDKLRPSQKEVDTARILQALSKARRCQKQKQDELQLQQGKAVDTGVDSPQDILPQTTVRDNEVLNVPADEPDGERKDALVHNCEEEDVSLD